MERARGFKPITEQDLTKAYSQYGTVGAKFGVVKKTDTDTQLFNTAKKYVLNWWKKQKTDAAVLAKPPAKGENWGPVKGDGLDGYAKSIPSVYGNRTSSSGSSSMPDTAMSRGPTGPIPKPLPHIPSPKPRLATQSVSEKAQMKLEQQRADQIRLAKAVTVKANQVRLAKASAANAAKLKAAVVAQRLRATKEAQAKNWRVY